MEIYSLEELVSYAKKSSVFYQNLYSNIDFKTISDLPVIDPSHFWSADILTQKNPSGIVFKSGGSTGSPKHSYFTHEEWRTFTSVFGWGIAQNILKPHDRIANLFYVGDMYASFLFIKDSLEAIDTNVLPLLQFPLSGGMKEEQILKTLDEFSINVLAGVPTAILNLLEYYTTNITKYPNIKINKILFGGEALYSDQEKIIKDIFRDIQISSIGLASVDGGLLGFRSPDCKNKEHRVFDQATIIELIDPDTHEIIIEKNKVGKVLLTNLTRKLMPIIRFPAGDMAEWIEDPNTPNRKFCLVGRAEEAARLGTISIYFEEIRLIISKNISTFQFQMIIKHFDNKDQLTIRIAATQKENLPQVKEKIINDFALEKKDYHFTVEKKLIHPLAIEFTSAHDLEINSRTGKLKRILDLRTQL